MNRKQQEAERRSRGQYTHHYHRHANKRVTTERRRKRRRRRRRRRGKRSVHVPLVAFLPLIHSPMKISPLAEMVLPTYSETDMVEWLRCGVYEQKQQEAEKRGRGEYMHRYRNLDHHRAQQEGNRRLYLCHVPYCLYTLLHTWHHSYIGTMIRIRVQ